MNKTTYSNNINKQKIRINIQIIHNHVKHKTVKSDLVEPYKLLPYRSISIQKGILTNLKIIRKTIVALFQTAKIKKTGLLSL